MGRTLDDLFVVILAGGSGTRFWPKSRQLRPKQLCAIGSADKTMLEITLSRLDSIVPPERRIIVTHHQQLEQTRAIAGSLCHHVIAEPDARNTANALALAALYIKQLTGSQENPLMISLHADHIIQDVATFQAAILDATLVARQGFLTLIGITPRYAETGFGYIERGAPLPSSASPSPKGEAFLVSSFKEKPDLETAQAYVSSKKYFWNAGMFVWQTNMLLDELRLRLPRSIELLEQLIQKHRTFAAIPEQALFEAYAQLPKISIDHAVLEVSNQSALIPADIGWQDVGSWDALSRCFPTDDQGNQLFGDGYLLNCHNTTVDVSQGFAAVIGLDNVVVVTTDDATLVCHKDYAQQVKNIVEHLKEKGRTNLT